MALTIYGSPRSRTMRTLWMAAELGLDYTHVPLAFDDPKLKQPAFLAINLYLAKKYGAAGRAPLYPTTAEGEAEAWRWTLWAQAHLEPWVQRDALMLDLRAAIGRHADATIANALAVLEGALAKRTHLITDHFTVADFNVACVLSPSRAVHLDLSRYPHVERWLRRCYERPAAIAVRRRFDASGS